MAVREQLYRAWRHLFYFCRFAPRLIARYSTSAILLTGLAIQLVGLVALIATFRHWGMHNTALTLAPATGLVGYGQALIVNSFYRIGMRDIQPDDAGRERDFKHAATGCAGAWPGHFRRDFAARTAKSSRRLHPCGQCLPDGGNGHDGGAGAGHAAYAPSSVFTGRQGLSGDKIKLPEFA